MTTMGNLSTDDLRAFIERVERLVGEKKDIAEDIKAVFAEAKGGGFDVKTMKEIIKLRNKQSHEREEQEYLLDTYKRALGMVPELDETTENGE
ncbi:MAG: DUF2312 domain-containing protein [Methylococcaceae bacterium]